MLKAADSPSNSITQYLASANGNYRNGGPGRAFWEYVGGLVLEDSCTTFVHRMVRTQQIQQRVRNPAYVTSLNSQRHTQSHFSDSQEGTTNFTDKPIDGDGREAGWWFGRTSIVRLRHPAWLPRILTERHHLHDRGNPC